MFCTAIGNSSPFDQACDPMLTIHDRRSHRAEFDRRRGLIAHSFTAQRHNFYQQPRAQMLQRDLASVAETNCIPMSFELRAGLREQNGFFLADIPSVLQIAWNTLQNQRSARRHADGLNPWAKAWQRQKCLDAPPQISIAPARCYFWIANGPREPSPSNMWETGGRLIRLLPLLTGSVSRPKNSHT